MFAHQVLTLTGPAGLAWNEVPEPGAGDVVVIDVAAAGVSFADLLQTRGQYQLKLPLPFTPGMDAAGVVRSAPRDAGLEPGQRVAVLMSHGCWQEVLAADPGQVLPLPDGMRCGAGCGNCGRPAPCPIPPSRFTRSPTPAWRCGPSPHGRSWGRVF